jgi:hypothetical protein
MSFPAWNKDAARVISEQYFIMYKCAVPFAILAYWKWQYILCFTVVSVVTGFGTFILYTSVGW